MHHPTRLLRFLTAALSIIGGAAWLLLAAAQSAKAKPEYAQKEQKACQYCHVSGTPGAVDASGKRVSTARNKRGMYYQMHNRSFDGYQEEAVMGKGSPPVFHFVWSATLEDPVKRIAVADVTGDGKPRLVTLAEKPGSPNGSVLAVRKWDGKAFVTEFRADISAAPEKLQVGRFAGPTKPAVIVTADALWSWDGKTFARKPAPAGSLALLGAARLKTGEERLLVAPDLNKIEAFRVDPAAANWLADPMPANNPSVMNWFDMHGAPEFFAPMQLQQFTSGGLLGYWDPRKQDKKFLYYVKVENEVEQKPGSTAEKPEFVLRSQKFSVNVVDPSKETGFDVWASPQTPARPLDIALTDVKEGGPGLLVLTSASLDGKGRGLLFFALD